MKTLTAVILLCFFCACGALRADLEAIVRADKLILTDGTEIECQILAITERAVLIVETDADDPEIRKQRAIPRHAIKSIERGENEGLVEGFQTGTELGRKVITAAGFREDAEPKSGGAGAKEKKGGDEKVAADPKDPKAKKEPKKKEVVTGPVGPKGPGKAGVVFGGKTAKLANEGVAGTIKGQPRELAEAYLQRFPALRDAAQSFMGPDQLQKSFEQIQKGDAAAKSQAESFMGVFFGGDSSAIGQMMAAGGTVKPQRGERVKRQPKTPAVP